MQNYLPFPLPPGQRREQTQMLRHGPERPLQDLQLPMECPFQPKVPLRDGERESEEVVGRHPPTVPESLGRYVGKPKAAG